MHNQAIILQNDVAAVQIPSGDTIILPAGVEVWVTQTLGGSYTLSTNYGLVRIKASDAGALGVHPGESESGSAAALADLPLEEQVWEQLKHVYDPEIPVDIVNLGLVYDCVLTTTEEGKTRCTVKMTLTAPGCGMGPVIAEDARQRILMLDGIDEAEVEIVWEPVWNQDMLSEEGRMKLGLA